MLLIYSSFVRFKPLENAQPLPPPPPPTNTSIKLHIPDSAKTDLPTAIAFITTVRPYVEPYVEPLVWRGLGWFIGDAERPSDAVREVERFKEQQREKEKDAMEALGPYIYHERQEPGSMMCGQHALNSLLQGNYFTAPDLASIAKELDELEQNVTEGTQSRRSTNMDDTGTFTVDLWYFSVQVLENALRNTFGLTLTRWRSQEMRVFQSHPDNQLAFVLNLEQHWFTLRRFGHKHGKGFWFNLNSFLSAPEWVGSTYLGMVLEQAEREGYSVFVVRPADASNPEHGLPDTEADLLAETLNDSVQDAPRPPQGFSLAGSTGTGGRPGISGGGGMGGSGSSFGGTAGTERNAAGIAQRSERSSVPGLEDEDVELQRALQASLAAAASGGGVVYDFPDESGSSGAVPGGYGSTTGFGSSAGYGGSAGFGSSGAGLGLGYGGDRPPSRRTPPGAFPASALAPASDPPTPTNEPSSSSDADPVAASAARARARLEQVQREQAAAMHGFGFGAGMDEAVDEEGARRRREAADRVRRAREEEEDQIRLAMAESLRTHSAGVEEGNPEYFVTPPSTTQPSLPGSFPTGGDRHYDDEDAELQAALKASLEEATSSSPGPLPRPAAPASVPERVVPVDRAPVPVGRAPVPGAPVPASSAHVEDNEDEDEDEDEEEEEEEEEKTPAPALKAEVADAEEMRRRRLARFGG
ncbi:hypothetical protein FRC09_000980 [Ceratobasidium sp. 395]|nr:hypothetical protein FRC09_000980 [Ceratobasidium sp. 395]